jgi:hypothetical protein
MDIGQFYMVMVFLWFLECEVEILFRTNSLEKARPERAFSFSY